MPRSIEDVAPVDLSRSGIRPLPALLLFFVFLASVAPGNTATTDPPSVVTADRAPALRRPLPEAAPLRGPKHLGWVVHWFEKRGVDRYPTSGARGMLTNLFAWRMRDEPSQLVDFRGAGDWLRFLYRFGFHSAVIIDTSIHHSSVPWRSAVTANLGENVCDQDGNPTPYASPFSPRFRRMVDRYVRDITAWVSRNDPQHRVSAYVDGAEVFWPGRLDWGPMAAGPFRRWLLDRYGSLDAVNRRWGADFQTAEEILPPKFYRNGATDFAPSSFEYGAWHDAGWFHTPVRILPRRRYLVSVEVHAEGTMDGRAAATLIWRAPRHEEQRDVIFAEGDTGGFWRRLRRVATSPGWARTVTLHLGLRGKGRVRWRAPELSPEFGGPNLLPNPALETNDAGDVADWSGQAWAGAAALTPESDESGETVLEIRIEPEPCPFRFPSAAWHDFVTFSMETYARAMNQWARRIRECDPSREVMHYCGFTLGFLGQWDDLTLTQMPDIFFSNADAADINGFQACSAGGDFHYATVLTDLIRKYDKPMVATDLQDFTHGVHVGFSAMNRTALALVAHGLDGAYAYCWKASRPPAYNWLDNWPDRDSARWMNNIDRLIDFLRDADLETPAAFLVPLLPYCESDPFGLKSDMFDCIGWYKMIQQAGAAVDVWTPYEAARAEGDPFERYRVVIVPDCPNLPAAAAERLRRFARLGGTVLFSGRPPHLDETGRDLPRPLLPRTATLSLRYRTETVRIRSSRAQGRPDSPGRSAACDSMNGGPTLVGSDGEWPGIVREPCGRGFFVWTGGLDGRAYLGPVRRYRVAGNTPPLWLPDAFERWPRPEGLAALGVVREILRDAKALPAVRLDPPDPAAEISVWRKRDEWRIVLIHTGPGNHHGGELVFPETRPGQPECLADFIPAEIPDRSAPDPYPSSLLDLQTIPGARSVDDGAGVRVPLPPFRDVCIVRW